MRVQRLLRRGRVDHRAAAQALLAAAVLAALAQPAPAQRQFEELGKRGLPPDRDPTSAVASGDVDGDGDRDLVFGNSGQQNRLYLNDGTGTFTDATAARMPVDNDWTGAVALGDLDGDGDLDLVFGNGGQSRLYVNDGTGTFTDATAARMPSGGNSTTSVALGDVDGDRDLDLVLGNQYQQNRLYLNNGTGTFVDGTAARMPVAFDSTLAVVLGDVDGDGDLDLVCGNGGYFIGPQHQNRLHLNDGSGTFTDATAARMPVDGDWTHAVAIGDVDGDGDLDLVFGNFLDPDRLYRNDGAGTFTDATATRMPVHRYWTTAVALADVDGDLDLDLVLGGQRNRIYANDGTGTFTDGTAARMTVGGSTSSVAVADVDGDRDLDLAFGGQPKRLYFNDGTGVFADATATRMPVDAFATRAAALGDIDADGDLDLVFGNGDGLPGCLLYRNDGTGTFEDATAARLPSEGHGTRAVALGDVDGDGDLDLVLGKIGPCYYSGYCHGQQNRLYLNDGAGTFTDATAHLPLDSDWTEALALGDVDGDGDLDLVTGNSGAYNSSGQDRLYLNDGKGAFTDATSARMPLAHDSTRALALGDVDGDGDLDLVFANGGQSRLCVNDGTGTFTDATVARMPAGIDNTTSVALGDVDRDGDLDLVLANFGQSRLYENNGAGTFTDATAARMPAGVYNTTSVALGDMDGDGDADLVLGNTGLPFAGQQNRLYLNDGTGTFSDGTARLPSDSDRTQAVALGDVDGDGDLDLVFANGGQSRIYVNLLRQLDVPFVLRIGHTWQLDVHARYGPSRRVDLALPFVSPRGAWVPLPPFGVLGLDPTAALPLRAMVIHRPERSASLSMTVPNDPVLVGLEVHAQALLRQLPGAAYLTNATTDVIAR